MFLGWIQHVNVDLHPTIQHRGFSCEVITSQFYKSSYLRPPCWFPPRTGGYWKTQQNVHTTIPNCNWVTRIPAHTPGLNFKSFHEVKRKFKLFFFSSYRSVQKGNQETWQSRARIRYESDDVIWLRNHAYTWMLVPNIRCKQTMVSNTGGPLTFSVFTHFFSDYPKAIRRGEISFKSNHVIERNLEAANRRVTGTSSGQL